MKKVLALCIALALCLGVVSALADEAPVKVAALVPVSTHAWVSGISYQADVYGKDLEAAGKIVYKAYTSSNAEEMTAQIDVAILWGAKILIVAPQWTGMDISHQIIKTLYGQVW